MKNYNGSHPSTPVSHHSTTVKQSSTNHPPSSTKASGSPGEPFTLHDLKHEYTKALSFIDKLKAEQNSIKNNLRMALDTKSQPPSPDGSSHHRTGSAQIKRNVPRDTVDNKRVMDLEIENSELRSQVDTTNVRLAKLQREKQALQDKLVENDMQSSSNREFVSEIRALSQEIKVLKVRLQEVEEENNRLSKHKNYEKSTQKPTQNLIRYVNYVSKLVASMNPTNFARSCYEERFPRVNDAYDLLESGQWEAVMLKSYKYITDLLINLNSLTTEENSSRALEVAIDSGNQLPSRIGSRRNSPTSSKDQNHLDSSSRRIQPPQEGSFRPQKLRFESLETFSTVKSPALREEEPGSGNEACPSSEYENSRRNLHKIVNGIDDNKGYKKPTKRHTRHYSTSFIAGYKPVQDSFAESSVVESASRHWETRLGAGSACSQIDDNNYSVKGRRHQVEARRIDDEVPENCPVLSVKPAKVEKHAREYDEEDDLIHEEAGRVKPRVRRSEINRDREARNLQNSAIEDPEGEEVYRSEFVKARIAATAKNQKEEEGRRTVSDKHEQMKKRTRDNREEEPVVKSSTYLLNQSKALLDPKRREINIDDRSRSPSVQEEEEAQEFEEIENKVYKTQDNSSFKSRNKAQAEKAIEAYYKSRSIAKDDEIIEETQESEPIEAKHKPRARHNNSSKTRGQDDIEEEEDAADSKQQMWDRKREELARANRKMNCSMNTSTEMKGQDFSTFSVSFGRTESKAKLSRSPSPTSVSNIMEVPRKKRIDHLNTKYDVITGQDFRNSGLQTMKAEERSPTVRFSVQENKRILSKKSSSNVSMEIDGEKMK